MITNCLPFAVFISTVLSFVILLLIMIFSKKTDLDNLSLFIVSGAFFIFLILIVGPSFPVNSKQETEKISAINTKQETIIKSSSKEVLFVYPKKSFTNGIYTLKKTILIGFLNNNIKTNYVIAP